MGRGVDLSDLSENEQNDGEFGEFSIGDILFSITSQAHIVAKEIDDPNFRAADILLYLVCALDTMGEDADDEVSKKVEMFASEELQKFMQSEEFQKIKSRLTQAVEALDVKMGDPVRIKIG